MVRRAACSCGALAVTCEGEPVRISLCNCLSCQRRTGSTFGVQARWPSARLRVEGVGKEFVRTGESGGAVTFRFCAHCGTTVYWTLESAPDLVAVAVGAFADPSFPAPRICVYERTRHAWVRPPPEAEHVD
jgi:hypothetical protein